MHVIDGPAGSATNRRALLATNHSALRVHIWLGSHPSRHSIHVLNDWFGHSAAVADGFYLQVTERDFEGAIGGNAGGNILAHQGPITDELGELLTLWQSMTDEARRHLLAVARGLT